MTDFLTYKLEIHEHKDIDPTVLIGETLAVEFKDMHWILTYNDGERIFVGKSPDQLGAVLDYISDRLYIGKSYNKYGLRPCPLCQSESGPEYVESRNDQYGYVQCTMCGLHLTDNIGEQRDGEAIRVWNTRPVSRYG